MMTKNLSPIDCRTSFISTQVPFCNLLWPTWKVTTTIQNEEERLMLSMFYYTFYKSYPEKEGFSSIEEGVRKILDNVHLKKKS